MTDNGSRQFVCRFLTIPEVADQLDLSISSVRRAIAGGALVYHKFGRTVRISVADLDAFVTAQRGGDAP